MSNGTAAAPVVPALPRTFEDSIALLTAKVKETGVDDWRMKVTRRGTPGAVVESVAVLDGCRVEHFSSPELWLPALCGGGPYYILGAYHASDPNTLLAAVVPAVINLPPRPVNPAVMNDANWPGPSRLVFAAQVVQQPQPGSQPGQQPTVATEPFTFFSRSTPFGAGGPPQGGRAENVATPGAPAGSPFNDPMYFFRREQEISEARHKLEVEEQKRSLDNLAKQTAQQISAIGDTVKTAVQALAARPVEPAKTFDPVSLISALAPITTAFMAQQASDRRAREEAEAKREEREARTREEANKRMDAMLERIAGQGAESAKVMGSMSEAFAQMSRVQVQTLASMQELMRPEQPQDEGIVGLLKAGFAAYGEYAAMKQAGMLPQGSQPSLPPAQGPVGGMPAQPQQPQQPVAEEEPVAIADADAEDVAVHLVQIMQAKTDPREVVATYIEAMQTNAKFNALVGGFGRTINFFQQRLGGWIAQNMDYLKQVLTTLQQAQQLKQ